MQMFGYVERDGRRLDMPFLSGSWRSRLVADMPDGSHWTVFEVNPLPSGPNRCYSQPVLSVPLRCSAGSGLAGRASMSHP